MINKNKIVFDPADVANSDFVGSYVIGADGTNISHTNANSKDGLDVYLINSSIAVTATSLDIRHLAFATDKVDASGSSVSISNGAGGAAVNIQDGGNSITVDGTVAISGTVAVTQSTSPWVVSATALDIRHLAFATDKVDASGSSGLGVSSLPGSFQGYADGVSWASGDFGAEMLAVRHDANTALTGVTDGKFSPLQVDSLGALKVSGNLNVNDAMNAISATAKPVLITATKLVATALSNRKRILVQNLGNKAVYIGDSGVTVAAGTQLFAGASVELDISPSIDLYAISASGTQDIRIMELA